MMVRNRILPCGYLQWILILTYQIAAALNEGETTIKAPSVQDLGPSFYAAMDRLKPEITFSIMDICKVIDHLLFYLWIGDNV